MLQSRRVSFLEEMGCDFGSDEDVVLAIKEQHSRLASCLGEEDSAVIVVLSRKEDKGCILFGRGGLCGLKQVQMD